MPLIRPEITAWIHRWREALAAAVLFALGVWLILLGGWLLTAVGVVLLAAATVWGVIAIRRVRFSRGVTAPGVVEVSEGRVGYFAPGFGGFISLCELVEIQMVAQAGTSGWRLKQADGQVLIIPTQAEGADALHDAFVSLPGIDMAALTAALDTRDGAQVLWTRARAHSLDLTSGARQV